MNASSSCGLRRTVASTAFLMILLGTQAIAAVDPSREQARSEFFELEVRPLLVRRCYSCHGGEGGKPKAGLDLTRLEAILKGGESGPAAVPGKPEESLLIGAIEYLEEPRMPPKSKMPEAEINTLKRWVALGMPWPASPAAEPRTVSGTNGKKEAGTATVGTTKETHWSFQPVRTVPVPVVEGNDAEWARTKIDRFILAKLHEKGLKPSHAADKRTLIRRATFDLTGLPPTPAEVDAFLADTEAGSFDRVLDRLLASPRYGERWGRHWLDVVRYTDSFDARGLGGKGDIAEAWRYRDWVVEAFNRDLPYDQFVIDQIAGDLDHADSQGASHVKGTIATGMLAIGNWGGGDADKEKLLTDIADDQVDVVSRAFMGLTVACARCHDHKFDPISTRDYYGMAGIFFSSHILPSVGPKTGGPEMLRIPLLSPAESNARAESQQRVEILQTEINSTLHAARSEHLRRLIPRSADYLRAAWEQRARAEANGVPVPLEEFARGKDLEAPVLREWVSVLGLDLSPPLLHHLERELAGQPGVHLWRGEAPCPSLTVNTTDKAIRMTTLTLPPRGVTVHPGPVGAVSVSWTSPLVGKVLLKGKLIDADSAGGDGVAWTLDHSSGMKRSELARGESENGSRSEFQTSSSEPVIVQPGDRLTLQVFPKGGYTCDTTQLELEVNEANGERTWSLARDLVDQPGSGNPHPDRLGNAEAWRFEDRSDERRMYPVPAELLDALKPWIRVTTRGEADRGLIEQAALDVRKRLAQLDEASPVWLRFVSDESVFPERVGQQLASMRQELARHQAVLAVPVPVAIGAQEGGVPGSPHEGIHDVRVHLRGSYSRLGELVPRQVPTILAGDFSPKIGSGSGRLELARWLTHPKHPLTARVMVNRIWQHHFGSGIVRTPGNFGKLGEAPTNPELLDYLAQRFIQGGWSVKQMHRIIMRSSAYQQSSQASAHSIESDPENLWFGRMARRRLESEALRDSLLMVSGELEVSMAGPATQGVEHRRRTLYSMSVRSDRSSYGPLFDAADSTAMVDVRNVSTVAPQALFLLNHPFVIERAQRVADSLSVREKDPTERIKTLYQRFFSRPPDPTELEIGLAYLASGSQAEARLKNYAQILMCSNEFVWID